MTTSNPSRQAIGKWTRRVFQRPYYGWMIVVLAALAMAATLPGRTHGLGLITKRLLDDMQLQAHWFAHLNLWATLLGAAFCLPCGWWIDRAGVRVVLTAVLACLAASVLWLSQITDPTLLWLAVTFTRGFGQSMLSVVSITMVAKWFGRRLKPAMAVYSVLMSLMMASITGLMGYEIIQWGWRTAWQGLGWALLLFVGPAWLLTRDQPRDRSLEFSAAHNTSSPESTAVGATLAQAIRTPCFWMFSLSISFFGLISAGLSLFNQYVLEERGFSETVFHNMLVVGLVVGMLANLAAGWAADRWPMQRLLSSALFLLAGALACFPFVQTQAHVYTYAVAKGIAGGVLTVLFFSVWAHAFGTKHVGRIQAMAQMITVFASAIGPLVVEMPRQHTGSYGPVFWTSAVLAFLFAGAAWFTPVPHAVRDDST